MLELSGVRGRLADSGIEKEKLDEIVQENTGKVAALQLQLEEEKDEEEKLLSKRMKELEKSMASAATDHESKLEKAVSEVRCWLLNLLI